jgi:polyhydroxyalkanoate synthesis regulator phasin
MSARLDLPNSCVARFFAGIRFGQQPKATEEDHVTAYEQATATTTNEPDRPSTELAKDEAKAVAATAKDEAASVTRAASTAASDVAGTAKEQVSQIAGEAKTQITSLTSQAREQVSEQATVQTHKVAQQASSFADQLHALARGDATEGVATDLVRDIAERIQELARRLESKEPQELLEDVRRYARNKPGTFLVGAMAAGFVGGRLMKGVTSADSESQSSSSSYSDSGTRYRPPDSAYAGGSTTYLGGAGYSRDAAAYPEEPSVDTRRTGGLGSATGSGYGEAI